MRSSSRVRTLLGRALVALAVVGAAVVVVAFVIWSRADVSTVGELSFERELAIPPLLEPEESDGRKVFELEMREGTSELRSGQRTPTAGYNSDYLGPTLRASRGDTVQMRVTNGLSRSGTTTHWHGMHLPAVADGGPHQVIAPGDTWTPSWTIEQPASSLWYHPHPHGETEEQVYRGLAGMFIVDDPGSLALELPHTYGVDDVPVIVQDKRFEENGELSDSEGTFSPIGQLGDAIVVNGSMDPHLDVTTTRVRLRLLNASTARSYNFGFSDDRPFDLIATDGGLLEVPARLNRIQLSPGERAEIVVEFSPGEEVVLRSAEPDLGETDFWNARFAGGDDAFDILELRAAAELADSPDVPATLGGEGGPDPTGAERVRRFELGSRDINDRSMDLSRIDQVVPVDTTEVWEVNNGAGIPHNFHPHGTQFRVLEYDGAPPPPSLRGLKDTVFIPPDVTTKLAVSFTDYPDRSAPFMFHCHLLQHEDRGMMGQFVVAESDHASATSRTDSPHEDD
jgi:blue copper oxidase